MFCAVNDFSVMQRTQNAERLAIAIAALGTDLAPASKSRIAEAAGFQKQILSDLLVGKRTLNAHWAHKLAPVLGVTAGYLLGNEELPAEAAS